MAVDAVDLLLDGLGQDVFVGLAQGHLQGVSQQALNRAHGHEGNNPGMRTALVC